MLKNEKNIIQLYRKFQEKRDNISPEVLYFLLGEIKKNQYTELPENYQKQKEAQISKILQTASVSIVKNGAADTPKNTLKDRLKTFLENLFTPSFGGAQWGVGVCAVLALMLTINFLPSPSKHTPYLDVTYLENCSVCGQIAMSSTTKVRNIDFTNIIKPSSSNARFGRLVLDLELLSLMPTENTGTNSKVLINSIKQLSKEKSNHAIVEYFDQFDANHTFSQSEVKKSIEFLNTTFDQQGDGSLYHAGQWLERLRITTDSGLRNQNFSSIQHALTDIETVKNKLTSNKNVTSSTLLSFEKLSDFQNLRNFDANQAKQISTITKELFQSLNM